MDEYRSRFYLGEPIEELHRACEYVLIKLSFSTIEMVFLLGINMCHEKRAVTGLGQTFSSRRMPLGKWYPCKV